MSHARGPPRSSTAEGPLSHAYGPIPRKEDARFIRGQGTFVDDITLPGMLHGAVLRSPLAHARIISRRRQRRPRPPGRGRCADRRRSGRTEPGWMPTLFGDVQAVLATDKVRFQGQEIAFVVATDRYAARDALELISVDYEPLPPLIDPLAALEPGAPVVRGGSAGSATTSSTGAPGTRRPPTRSSPPPTWWSSRDLALPALAPGAAGNLRRDRRLRPGPRQADPVGRVPGPARAPGDLFAADPGCPSTRSGRVA